MKRKTTLPKITSKKRGRLKETESSADGTAQHVIGASQADIPCDGQRGRDVENELQDSRLTAKKIRYVPVVDKENNPLMPTTPARARKWIKSKKATGFWKMGIYCMRLNVEPSSKDKQEICVGGDTGSKKEALTIKSTAHTFLNIQMDAVTWVKENIERRRNLRRSRRQRTTPYRKCRWNRRIKNFLPPSTKSRWDLKLRVINKIIKIFPITHSTFENIAAVTKKGQRKWNVMFSPLEYGKTYFYNELKKFVLLDTKQGYETAELRRNAGLPKLKNKLSGNFYTHCVDSWVLANHTIGGHITPDNVDIIYITPLRFFRRQLHVQNPTKGGVRKKYGGTISMGFKRGSLVTHPKYGLCFVGGTCKEKISLHNITDGSRIYRKAKQSDMIFLAYNSFLTNYK